MTDEETMESWRKKAIDYLEKSTDEEIKKAIIPLKEGKGWLTHYAPIMIKFYSDIK